ncbi:MAG: hypothetical protein CM1200mP2_31750 [Planctomycetaceae bacterium]|nr:MAG: hypothetical protein CM1200mP2_31750 [Planctomycetaceae bacterium]
MNRPPHAAASLPDPTIRMSEGWHCLHMYYRSTPPHWPALMTTLEPGT